MVQWLSTRTQNTRFASSNPARVTTKISQAMKATGNRLIKSMSLGKIECGVSGFCYPRNLAYDVVTTLRIGAVGKVGKARVWGGKDQGLVVHVSLRPLRLPCRNLVTDMKLGVTCRAGRNWLSYFTMPCFKVVHSHKIPSAARLEDGTQLLLYT